MSLCGLFLRLIPHPTTQAVGNALMAIGGALTSEGIYDEMEEQRREDRENRKK